MRRIGQALAIGSMLSTLFAAAAHGDDAWERDARLAAGLDRALRAACYGVPAEHLTLQGHHFEVGSARFVRAGTLVIIEGELLHRGSQNRHVLVGYTIRKRGAAVVSVDVRIEQDQRWRPATSPAAQLAGVMVSDDQLAAVQRRFARAADDRWESTAKLIITSIALRADEFGRDRLALHRAKLSHTGGKTADAIIVPRADRRPIDRG